MLKVTTRKLEDMKKVLMDGNVSSPAETYFVVKSPGQNITILLPNMLGMEFNKTFGHYHKPAYPEKYTVLYGDGAVLMQRLKDPENYYGSISEVKFVRLKLNEEFLIPEGFGHILVNLGPSLLITRDDWDDKNAEHMYDPIAEKKGMGYYVLRNADGGVAFSRNPNYEDLPELICP